MRFYHNIIKSFTEIENCCSMIIHSIEGCNLRCFGCHNYKELIETEHEKYYNESDMIDIIKKDGNLFDCLIFSGGEFLISSIDELTSFLTAVRDVYSGIIIVNTNGSNPGKLKSLLSLGLIDGAHVDMKLPYHLMDVDGDSDIFKQVLGIVPTRQLVERFLLSIDIALSCGKYSRIRTVRYPVLDDTFFDEIEKYVECRKEQLGSTVGYDLNTFMEV